MERAELEALSFEGTELLALIAAVCPAEVDISLSADAQGGIKRQCQRLQSILWKIAEAVPTVPTVPTS